MVAAEDHFVRLSLYNVAICKICYYAVWPDQAGNHLKTNHHGLLATERRAIVDYLGTWNLSRSDDALFALPRKIPKPISQLPFHPDGLQCRLQPETCTIVYRDMKSPEDHWRKIHKWRVQGTSGGATHSQRQMNAQRRADAFRAVSCQRFFRHGRHSTYFAISADASVGVGTEGAPVPNTLEDAVLRDLASLESAQHAQADGVLQIASAKETSPWLQLTRWTDYLQGHHLRKVATLAAPADKSTEPILAILCQSIDRPVDEAYQSVCSDVVNVFGQARINSFLQRPRAADRPLLVKLQKSTWRTYITIWKALICFAFRSTRHNQKILLRHRLTSSQVVCLDECMKHAERLLELTPVDTFVGDSATAAIEQATDLLDNSCLDLCISLLDHDLEGDLFESVVVGFLAVIEIDSRKAILKEAYHYTPTLSGFIKIAQMLVIQKAVVASRDGTILHPADLLDEMRARCLIHGTRSPFSWPNRLRMYGKKVRDSTTCLGYIAWSGDGQTVTYKDVAGLSIKHFKGFVRDQVAKAQGQLEELLLLHPEESREDLGIDFWMHRIVDNAAENRDMWNFLQHTQNLEGTLPDRSKWLLERVLRNKWLQEEFLYENSTPREPKRKQSAVRAYRVQVDEFLATLLLLIHLTAGQPARGTEILSLRYVDTINGHHRNIFIDGGTVSTVTTYHKGYSVIGSTKIIHRYLPK